jgi:2-haloacid dehalogenase
MSRRQFLQLTGAAALAACVPHRRTAPPSTGPIAAVAFDLFTLFDPRGVERAVEAALPGEGAELARLWRGRQFEYAFLRAAAGQYTDFRRVTEDALDVAATARGHALSPATRARLVDAYQELEPWPDARPTLLALRAAGLRLAPLANYAPSMLRALLDRAGFTPLFDHLLSTDLARTFKPDPRAYQLGVDAFALPPARIAFSAFGGWDAAGAAWFGYPTFWVNRLGVLPDRLAPEGAFATGHDLGAVRAWLSA